MTRAVLIALLVAHTAITFAALRDESVWSVFPPFQQRYVYQIFSDLCASLGMVFLLCYHQLRRRGRSMRGLVITMLGAGLLGSFAPLIFLLVEKDLFD